MILRRNEHETEPSSSSGIWIFLVLLASNHSLACLVLLLFARFRWQAKQLKDYENAVIAKRLEELDEDEVQALVEEVEKDSF